MGRRVTIVRTPYRHTVLLVILAIGGMGAQPVFAKGGRGLGHVAAKSVRLSEPRAKPALRGDNTPQGSAKADAAHAAVTRGVDKPSEIDTRISVQPRLPGKRVNPNKSVAQAPYPRRTLSAPPRMQSPPVRNAIGLPISPRGNLGPITRLHPNNLPGSRSVMAPAVPNNMANSSPRIGDTPERLPRPTPSVVSPPASRGAINGTGLANRHLGPPQIGTPNALAGINGTTIKRIH